MLTHIVFFRLKDKENIEEARKRLASLMGRVDTLKSLEVGADVLKLSRSYDIALLARFDSVEGLKAYEVHPYHVEVGGWIKGLCDSVVSVDYEG